MVRQLTADELKKKYETDLAELQKNCKHKDITDWIHFMWALGHYADYQVKQCNICWKILKKKLYCYGCGEQFVVDGDWNRSSDTDVLCPECSKEWKELEE